MATAAQMAAESYPATAACGHQVNVYPKALVKQMKTRLCVKCLASQNREVKKLKAEVAGRAHKVA